MNSPRLITWDAEPLSEEEVRVIEHAIGILPTDYRQFLLRSNGGRSIDELRFLFSRDTGRDYLVVESFEVIEPRLPPPVLSPKIRGATRRFIRVANGTYYAQFLLEIAGPQIGSIQHWDYQLEARWEAEDANRPYLPTKDTLNYLAPSFTAFVERLFVVPPHPTPNWSNLPKTVENFAKFGDSCFVQTEQFFQKMTLAELDEPRPKGDAYARPPIHYAANWSQPLTSRLLLDRGVDFHQAIRVCTNSFEITCMMIDAGATREDLESLLFNAAMGMGSTSSPEENHKIILHLLRLGVRPQFDGPAILDKWRRGVDQIFGKKILRFLLETFGFPKSIQVLIHQRLDRPPT